MNILKKFGAKLRSELGDLMIFAGLFLLPVTTYRISEIAAAYVLSAVLIVTGIYTIRAKGSDN